MNMKKDMRLFLYTIIAMNFTTLAKAQIEKCFIQENELAGIEETIWIDENDSFHSACLCWAYSKQDGTFKIESDTSILLNTKVVDESKSFYKVAVDSNRSNSSKFKFQLLDSFGEAFSEKELILVKRKTTSRTSITDQQGFIIDTSEVWDYAIILNEDNRTRKFVDLKPYYSRHLTFLKLTSLSHIKEYNCRITRDENDQYFLQDLWTKDITELKLCDQRYDMPKRGK
jgi:hypothetical protein